MNIKLHFLIFASSLVIANALYAQHPFKRLRLPDIYKNSSSVEMLADSIKSIDEGARVYSVIRLGQIGDEASIAILKEAYQNEPHYSAITDRSYGVKYYSLLSIGKIGGPKAISFFNELSSKLLSDNIVRTFKPNYYLFGDTLDIFAGLCKGMVSTGYTPYENKFLELFDDSQISPRLREISYQSYLEMLLKQSQYASFQDSVDFLLGQKKLVTGIPSFDSSNVRTSESIKNYALFGLLIEYGKQDPTAIQVYKSKLSSGDPFDDELDSLIAHLNAIIENERRANPSE